MSGSLNEKYRMLIEALDGTARDLARLIKPLDDAAALQRPAPDEWCVKDVVAHLADIEPQYRARMVRMMEQDEPREPFIGPNASVHDMSKPVVALIAAFAAERAQTTALLAQLTHQQWLRTCVHEKYGKLRLRKVVEILIGHDNEHLAQIVNLREFLEKRATANQQEQTSKI